MSVVRKWRLHHHGLTGSGINYHDGRFVVQASGTYLVFCHLGLHEQWNKTTNRPVQNCTGTIKHEVYRYNIEKDEQVLVSSQRPHQQSRNGYHSMYSSYLSSIVELQAGDEIYVKVSDIAYLSSPHWDYFGMKMI